MNVKEFFRKKKTEAEGSNPEVQHIRKIVRRQGLLALVTVVVIIVVLFAMTSAWYTNVSKVNTLRFRTEVWGFDPEKIEVNEANIIVAPGMSGYVPFQVDNSESSDRLKLLVTVSKIPMENDELRKRVYFYADAAEVRNGERVSKIYLGSSESDMYSYNLLPGEELVLSEAYHNDVPIKWEWVYDMEGYYFQGTVSPSGAVIDEYIRPIEYDLDLAVFDTEGENATGNLVSVGSVTAESLLSSISANDGYAGQINASSAVTAGGSYRFYPVDVDETGTGVWAYLCTYSEIEQGIKFDTDLSGTLTQFTAAFHVSAISVPSRIERVSTEAALRSALLSSETDVVCLSGNVDTSSAIVVGSDVQAVLNLDGYEIRYAGSEATYSMFRVRGGGSLTIMNGDVTGNGNITDGSGNITSSAFSVSCGNLTLSDVRILDFDNALIISDAGGSAEDSVVQIFNCEMNTPNLTIQVMGNGSGSEAPTRLIIKDSVLNSSGYAALAGHGNTDRWGTDFTIIDSTLYGYYTALYQPQQRSSTTITGSTLTGITGIAVKGGTVAITDSRISGTGRFTAARASGGGWTDTGDGIYVEATYNWNVSVTVKGNTVVTSANAYAAELFGVTGAGIGRIILQDGTYSGGAGAANWNDIGSFSIYGGTYTGSVSESILRYDGE
ncbi:MAG: hypothetical protein IK088_06400 [Lachnospiraceae bacterium]|nr:hypothetical protein [Lachnospiraceae bacterium]